MLFDCSLNLKKPSCEFDLIMFILLVCTYNLTFFFCYFLLLNPNQLPILFSIREQHVSSLKRLLGTVWVMPAVEKKDGIQKKKNHFCSRLQKFV